jgi:hypothetical protein
LNQEQFVIADLSDRLANAPCKTGSFARRERTGGTPRPRVALHVRSRIQPRDVQLVRADRIVGVPRKTADELGLKENRTAPVGVKPMEIPRPDDSVKQASGAPETRRGRYRSTCRIAIPPIELAAR